MSTAADFASIRRDEALLRPGVDAIVAAHRLPSDVVRFADGSLPVYAIGEAHVLKLYPPPYVAECETEASVLSTITGRLPIPTPRVEAVGEHSGWSYLLMERLRGESLATAWPGIGDADQQRLLAALGEALAALHAIRDPIRDPALAALAPPNWAAFVTEQRANAVERQRAKGLDAMWLAQIPAFLEEVPLELDGPRVLLHTEIMREHLLVREGARGWELSGLFDFEPAMYGAPEYELASLGVFVSCGNPRLLRALLLAYGYREDSLDEAFARRVLAYAIVHRYSNLRWYLERLPSLEAPTLDALARRGWGIR
ncbi:MAG TPA: aminoglycoside 3'-phosphotransferase/choline kinase family protein [Kofleriaceae bacterium]|nr:aminoglycoside 3'-phosphotransferase/choline kinase family protein [Kofleriaceae bacterium]